jgi:CBS domain-containing protein
MHGSGARRRPAGLYLESTPDERYGVLPGEDRSVGDVMTRRIVTIDPDASVQEAAQIMRDRRTPALVVSDGPRLVGLVTEQDIVTKGATQEAHPDSIPVRRILPPGEPVACRADAILADAARVMAAKRRPSLPVVDERGAVVGLLSWLDVAGAVMPNAAAAWLSEIRK